MGYGRRGVLFYEEQKIIIHFCVLDSTTRSPQRDRKDRNHKGKGRKKDKKKKVNGELDDKKKMMCITCRNEHFPGNEKSNKKSLEKVYFINIIYLSDYIQCFKIAKT